MANAFGGTSVIACGDLFELWPVCDSLIFQLPRTAYEQITQQENGGGGGGGVVACAVFKSFERGKTDKWRYSRPHLYLSTANVNAHNALFYEQSSRVKDIVHAHDAVVGNMSRKLYAILARIQTDPA